MLKKEAPMTFEIPRTPVIPTSLELPSGAFMGNVRNVFDVPTDLKVPAFNIQTPQPQLRKPPAATFSFDIVSEDENRLDSKDKK